MASEPLLGIGDGCAVVHDARPVGGHCEHQLPAGLVEEPALQRSLVREAVGQVLHAVYRLHDVPVDPGVAAIEPDVGVSAGTPAGLVRLHPLRLAKRCIDIIGSIYSDALHVSGVLSSDLRDDIRSRIRKGHRAEMRAL